MLQDKIIIVISIFASKVTLSEGPNHMAQFKGSTHQYDLTQENEVNNLVSVGFTPFLKVGLRRKFMLMLTILMFS